MEGIEHKVEATAGCTPGGNLWWGTRVYWRRENARRWEHFTIVDTHPFQYVSIEAALEEQVRRSGVVVA